MDINLNRPRTWSTAIKQGLNASAFTRSPHGRATRRTPTAAFLVLVAFAATSHGANALDVPPTIASGIVLQRFSVAKGGDGLVIPVSIGGKDHPFLVDTGSGRSLLDRALTVGKPEAAEIERTPDGLIVVGVHKPPEASIGTLHCRFESLISSADLRPMQEMSGLPVAGLLGMDVLGEHIIRIDFDKGELDILKSVPPDAETEIPMQWEPGDVPSVTGFLTGSEKLRMLIDTGEIGFVAGGINEQVARKLVASKRLRELGASWNQTLSGRSSVCFLEGDLLGGRPRTLASRCSSAQVMRTGGARVLVALRRHIRFSRAENPPVKRQGLRSASIRGRRRDDPAAQGECDGHRRGR